VLLSLFLTCFVALVLGTALLLALGSRAHITSPLLGVALTAAVALAAGWIAEAIWTFEDDTVPYSQAVVLAFGIIVVAARRVWNPVGQMFFATMLAAAASYLVFSVETTFGAGLSFEARLASGVLLLFEVVALVLSTSFTFESCDTLCRTRDSRRFPEPDPSHLPMVSIHLAAYNEPPDMLIETIQSLQGLDYPNFEVVIVDNNTKDPDVWQPVEEYCRGRPGLRFVHVDPWPGYKSGALNLALREHTHPDAEVIALVDADYHVDPSWLRATVGYFADPSVAFVQSPQDYREYEGDGYLQACYDSYKYFFVTTMPSRNQRNSIIFAGTMGLLRRSVLEEVGGWDEWCITEDAELSLRILRAGYQGVYVEQSYGTGIMPLTFAALKSQRFRWCFGGMQILRMHWRDLVPWRRARANRLAVAQKIDYLLGSVQWMNDLVYFGFTVVLIASAFVLINEGPLGLRPLYGATVLLPSALIVSGVVRALWAVRVKTGIGLRRAFLAFACWLALSWTVAIACVQGLTRKKGVFLRTPKEEEGHRLLSALWSARTETFWAVMLWTLAALAAFRGQATLFVLVLFAWQGSVYGSALFMSWLNQHTVLSAQLERRRRTEWLRERSTIITTASVGALGGAAVAGVVAFIIGLGGSNPGNPPNPFNVQEAAPESPAPAPDAGSPTTTTPSPSSTTTTSPQSPSSTTPDTQPTEVTEPPTTVPPTEPPTTEPPTTAPPAT
jgi:cellulose synthase/poly-beta-1,6-N-acetylglucosamine synthase-like glycosyltransferase